MEYEFNLEFKVASEDADHDQIMERLGEVGCTDALAGLGIAGHVGLEFVRERESAEAAIRSAINDVRKALPSAQPVGASNERITDSLPEGAIALTPGTH
ncbi:hypothetical protein QTI66_04770 [Variovorax sp. J22R133]|uniref:hypothetical protein n=1 Tax=Variovorax brevis TaxID=3053503 RepID=UPI0025762D39|nr:hypothetical protein [Variovorax sp. J22R133]MDM0111450.1 hypothetical protein [Variovorax sp. J22R133]